MTTGSDLNTGGPLSREAQAVETLADDELEAELTIAVYGVERSERRVELIVHELLKRRRGYGRPLSTQRK
jgi:hypothetical protein